MNIGLVLSGGGIRGVAHIGALKALETHGIEPTHISGTSAGALVGVLYAAGVKWEEINRFFKETPIFHPSRFALNKPGFIDPDKFYKDIKSFLSEDNYSALKKPFFVATTDLLTGDVKIFSEGKVIHPVLASASFPGVFAPTKIQDSYYVDGGILNNFPVEPLLSSCNQIIGSYVNPLKKVEISELKHSYQVVDRAYRVKAAAESRAKFVHCDILFSPSQLSDYGTFDMKAHDTIFEIGFTHAMETLESIKHKKK